MRLGAANETEFVERNTKLAQAELVPELTLRLGNMVIPLWELVESEFEAKGLAPPYWAYAWPGGQALARYILDRPELVRGRTVLDFASGCGIAGIAAARAGALSVLCADIDPLAQAACRMNGLINKISVHTTTDDLIGDDDLVPDVVLAGDIYYDRPLSIRVTRWLEAISAQGALVLVGDPGRNYLPRAGLAELSDYDIPTTRDLEVSDVKQTRVYRVDNGRKHRLPEIAAVPEDDSRVDFTPS
jgi:predicted nicotinamide N-methyase